MVVVLSVDFRLSFQVATPHGAPIMTANRARVASGRRVKELGFTRGERFGAVRDAFMTFGGYYGRLSATPPK